MDPFSQYDERATALCSPVTMNGFVQYDDNVDMCPPGNLGRHSDSAIDLSSYNSVPAMGAPTQFSPLRLNFSSMNLNYSTMAPRYGTLAPSDNAMPFVPQPQGPMEPMAPRSAALSTMDNAMPFVTQPPDPMAPTVQLTADKTKVRAEKEMKMQLVLDPLPQTFEWIRFPRRTLAKPKLLMAPEELKTIVPGSVVAMDIRLVCASAVVADSDQQRALRRAAGLEPIHRRDPQVPVSQLEKDDPAHPQNGGEILICHGCKERERKRHGRRKKPAEEEDEWLRYEDERVVIINDKEYKKFSEADPACALSQQAKTVDFAMRIACYCRHQEEKAAGGYRIILTLQDEQNSLFTQYLSDVFVINDDHKKDPTSEASFGSFDYPSRVPSVGLDMAAARRYTPTYTQITIPPAPPSAYGYYSTPQTPIALPSEYGYWGPRPTPQYFSRPQTPKYEY